MPVYDTTPSSPEVHALTPGQPLTLWSAETIAAGGKSLQFAMHRTELPNCLSVDIAFAADPGNCQVDLQTADEDVDAAYVSKTSINQANLNASFRGRIEAVNVVAKYARLVMVSKANAVAVTAKVY